jgi:hypothetical protein
MSGDADNPAPADGDAGQVLFPAVSTRDAGMWIAAVITFVGVVFASQALDLDFGSLLAPGPGFVPLLLSVLTAGLAVLIGYQEWRQKDSETVELGHRDVMIVIAAMVALPLLFAPLGAYLTLGGFGAALLVLVARTSVVVAVAAAAAGMVGCWYFFQVLLGLQLPMGAALEWLGSLWNG